MINKILIGIAQSLDAGFGESVPIHIEEIEQSHDEAEQGTNEPCFLLTPLIVSENQDVGMRYKRDYPFMVQYFSKSKKYRAECNEVSEKLLNILEYINMGDDVLHGTDMTSRIVDGILNFEVTYKLHIFKLSSTADEVMENLDHDLNVKE